MPWPYNRCILCLQEVPKGSLTREHIIPEQIGGKLWVRFLCNPCNSRLGSEIEREVKRDPSIRLALLNLEKDLPDLARKLEQRQRYVGTGPAGSVFGMLRDGAFRVDTVQSNDGSIIQPTPDGRLHIEKTLRKEGLGENQIQETLKRFDDAPAGEELDLGLGLAATKRSVSSVDQALDGPFCSHRLLLKIAFEFLVCHLGAGAYAASEPLTAMRGALFQFPFGAEVCSVEELTTRRYAPLHSLTLAGATPHATVTVCLFGWLAYRVHLRRIALASTNSRYVSILDTGEERFEILDKEGNKQRA